MRFIIEGVEGECVDCLCVKIDIHDPAFEELSKYEGGEVVTADEYADLDGRYTALMHDWQSLVDEKRTLENRVDAMTWQPIESVPKDGTPILLACHDEDPWVDEWMADEQIWMMCDQWTEEVIPTHWQPLPVPPKDSPLNCVGQS